MYQLYPIVMINVFIHRSAAKYHNIPYSSLYNGMRNHGGISFKGYSSQSSSILTPDEEQQIVRHVKWKADIGYDMTWEMVRYNGISSEL